MQISLTNNNNPISQKQQSFSAIKHAEFDKGVDAFLKSFYGPNPEDLGGVNLKVMMEIFEKAFKKLKIKAGTFKRINPTVNLTKINDASYKIDVTLPNKQEESMLFNPREISHGNSPMHGLLVRIQVLTSRLQKPKLQQAEPIGRSLIELPNQERLNNKF